MPLVGDQAAFTDVGSGFADELTEHPQLRKL